MKKLLATLMLICLTLTALPALAEDVEPNTMVAKINGEMYTLYLDYTSEMGGAMASFSAKDERGKTALQFVMYLDKNVKTGEYKQFSNDSLRRCWLNNDYEWDLLNGDAEYTQYIGGIWGNVIGASASDQRRMQNNGSEAVIRIDKATGYLFRGVFNARLHDVKKDEYISVQAKFDFTMGEHYEAPPAVREDSTLSLDDIDF
ncbi:MAG: hypothetical protein IKK21_03760 [Clostridia bacterium]|nr:hypothetical protein [Clostridia bacterium]